MDAVELSTQPPWAEDVLEAQFDAINGFLQKFQQLEECPLCPWVQQSIQHRQRVVPVSGHEFFLCLNLTQPGANMGTEHLEDSLMFIDFPIF